MALTALRLFDRSQSAAWFDQLLGCASIGEIDRPLAGKTADAETSAGRAGDPRHPLLRKRQQPRSEIGVSS